MHNGSVIDRGIEGAKEIAANGIRPLQHDEGTRKALELVNRSEIAMVGSHGDSDYPNIKAMFKIDSHDLQTVWFSTNTSSRRVSQFRNNPKACIYFFDSVQFAGLLLTGEVEVVMDTDARKQLWREGWEAYYPLGAADPDYCLLKFTAGWGNYYQGLQNLSFHIHKVGEER